MSVDFPRAWELCRESDPNDHHDMCSFYATNGAMLCDCDVLMKHPEVTSTEAFYTKGGKTV